MGVRYEKHMPKIIKQRKSEADANKDHNFRHGAGVATARSTSARSVGFD